MKKSLTTSLRRIIHFIHLVETKQESQTRKKVKKSASSREPAENLNCPELMEETESDENRRRALRNPDMMGEHTEFIARLFFKSSDKDYIISIIHLIIL